MCVSGHIALLQVQKGFDLLEQPSVLIRTCSNNICNTARDILSGYTIMSFIPPIYKYINLMYIKSIEHPDGNSMIWKSTKRNRSEFLMFQRGSLLDYNSNVIIMY